MMVKKLYAPKGDKVFTHIGKGLWTADLYNEPVSLERIHHNHWVCKSEKTLQVIGDGSTRNEAMREAFYNTVLEKGYDVREADRLDWILTNQTYRSYGGHKPRKKTSLRTITSHSPIIPKTEQPKGYSELSPDMILDTFISNLKQYRTAYNETLGGWLFYKRDSKGALVTGVNGPFKDAKTMLKAIIRKEMES